MTETLKIFFHLWPWQKITTQKLADQLYLSVPTVLKVLKECENWLDKYNMKLVNERGKGYCLKGEESSYRIAEYSDGGNRPNRQLVPTNPGKCSNGSGIGTVNYFP